MNPKQLKQDKLIVDSEASKLNIKSPVFKSRPGWGGQLSSILSKTSGSRVPLALGLTLVAFIGAYWLISSKSPSSNSKLPNSSENQAASTESLQATILSGQGLTHAARIVLREYLVTNDISLSAEQFIYAENNLRLTVPSNPVNPGQVVEFSLEDIKKVVSDARTAPASALEKLRPYVK